MRNRASKGLVEVKQGEGVSRFKKQGIIEAQ